MNEDALNAEFTSSAVNDSMSAFPWDFVTLRGNDALCAPHLERVTLELTLWALQLADPVKQDVARLELSR